MRTPALFSLAMLACSVLQAAESPEAAELQSVHRERIKQVAGMSGLVAFWDFSLMEDDHWTSVHDPRVVDRRFPVFLRRIGDPKDYTPADWPYADDASKLVIDTSGPLGHAVRMNEGYIFAEVPRREFDRTPLDLRGRNPFTLVAWVKFVGARHLVAGIWDEGGWNKYRGRRQAAIFGGLFNSQSLTAHISATGAASYPQSNAPGSQYARCRAIDGRPFANDQWIALAMTFEPAKHQVTAYVDGRATPTMITDPVAQDVFRYNSPVTSNPYDFSWPVASPRGFALKFNGYNAETSGVYEHWLQVDAESNIVGYGRSGPSETVNAAEYRATFNVERSGRSLLAAPIEFSAVDGASMRLPNAVRMAAGDEIVATLAVKADGRWMRVGTEVRWELSEGAPFSFGRARGLGNDPLDHGSQIFIDGVAVFDRVLSEGELEQIRFAERSGGSAGTSPPR